MAVAERLALQLGRPSGLSGRALGHVLNAANRWINRRAVERLGLTGRDSVLEVGFGGGVGLGLILKGTHGEVAGIEVSHAMLAHARRRFRGEVGRGRLALVEASVSAIRFADDRFDRALTAHSIYFWPEPARGLEEIHRVLRPGGRLVIATECPEDLGRRAYSRYGFRIFRDCELAELLQAVGFSDVQVEREGHRVFGSAVFATGVKPGEGGRVLGAPGRLALT